MKKKKNVTNFKVVSLDEKDRDVASSAASNFGISKLCYIKSVCFKVLRRYYCQRAADHGLPVSGIRILNQTMFLLSSVLFNIFLMKKKKLT